MMAAKAKPITNVAAIVAAMWGGTEPQHAGSDAGKTAEHSVSLARALRQLAHRLRPDQHSHANRPADDAEQTGVRVQHIAHEDRNRRTEAPAGGHAEDDKEDRGMMDDERRAGLHVHPDAVDPVARRRGRNLDARWLADGHTDAIRRAEITKLSTSKARQTFGRTRR